MPNYRKKPIIIEARQFPTDGTQAVAHAIYQWVEKNTLGSFEPLAVIEGREPWPESGVTIDPRDGRMVIATLEGGHWVTPGDFIIRGVQGEFYPCKSDIFEATYEPAETTPAHHETPDLAELRRLLAAYRAASGLAPIVDAWYEVARAAHAALPALLDAAAERDRLARLLDEPRRSGCAVEIAGVRIAPCDKRGQTADMRERDALRAELAHMTEARDNARVWDEGSDFVTRHPGMSAEYVRAANPYRRTEWNQHDRLDMPTNA